MSPTAKEVVINGARAGHYRTGLQADIIPLEGGLFCAGAGALHLMEGRRLYCLSGQLRYSMDMWAPPPMCVTYLCPSCDRRGYEQPLSTVKYHAAVVRQIVP